MIRAVAFTHSRVTALALCGVLAAAGALAASAARAQDHDRGHPAQHFDRGPGHFDPARQHFDRFNHDHFYPNRGTFVHALPMQHYDVVFHGGHYFFAGGVWYAPRGGLFVVVAPPFGLFVPVLPPFYTTVWVAGAPYYYADDVYYLYRGPGVGYEVVAPPPGQEVADAGPGGPPPGGPPGPPPGPDHQLFIYPRNGQTPEQQSRDQYECHTWASGQTGFDPTAPNGGVAPPQTASARADYNRAMAACLDGRGYTVR
ncbi:MAG TPA: DUF6515 family protein [Steroidobacteraceae bacterium]|nr:DUF6515 family protein [Steroidobacteraceae bacterium]